MTVKDVSSRQEMLSGGSITNPIRRDFIDFFPERKPNGFGKA